MTLNERKIELFQTDVIKVFLTVEDLKKLKINYIINIGKIDNFEKYNEIIKN